MGGAKVFLLLQLLSCAYGKHLPKHYHNEKKSYPRQMIIPNKFIPMLKQSALFKSRSSSNDLSGFLQPKSHEHDSVTGQTRQNLMDSMGMDPGQSQGTGTEDANGMGGMGQAGGMGEAGGMGGMGGAGGMGGMGGAGGMGGMGGAGGMGGMGGAGGMGDMGETGGEGGMNGMGGAGGMGMNGGMTGMGETGGMGGMEGAGGLGGINDQMKAMNVMGGMGNSDASQSPLEGNMQGGNAMDPMNNGGAEGMNSDANNPPAGDPMGTLKDMLSSQGTNAALGTDSQAFGPGGAASSNVLAMLNQIVGKEMPGESPVDPSSSSEQVWNQLQKNFESQKPSGVPYIDPAESKSVSEHVQQDIPVSNSNQTMNVANKPNPNTPAIPINNNSMPNLPTKKPPTSKPGSVSPLNTNSAASNAPIVHASTNSPATNPTSTTNIINKPRSQKESHANALTKTTSNLAGMDVEDDRPLSADMVKFLKGVKFVVSQEPGNDIILGKKFSSDVQHDLTDFKEENGVIKNTVSATNKLSQADRKWPMSISKAEIGERYGNVKTANPKGIVSSFAITDLLSKPNAKKKNPVEYVKAAKVLERASKKLKDPIAKKSTEIAVASILKIVALGKNKNLSSSAAVDLLNGGDVNNKLSEKYIEAARVLGTASKKLVDPVAKESTEIGIASILKVIALGDYPTSKKTFVPSLHRLRSPLNTYLNTVVDKKHEYSANEIVAAVKRTLRFTKLKKPSP